MNFPDVYTVGCADKLLKEYSAKTRNSREGSLAGYLQLLTTDPDVPVQARSEWYEKQILLAQEEMVFSLGSQSWTVMLTRLLRVLETGVL